MADSGPKYDEEYGERLVILCVATDTSKKFILSKGTIRKNNLNHFAKGRYLRWGEAKAMAAALNMGPVWLQQWLHEEDHRALNTYDRERVVKFQALSDAERIERAKELGWWLERGKPRKRPQSAPREK